MEKMTLKDVEEKLISKIATILSVEPSTVNVDSPLHTLGVDSLSFVELLVFIEKIFNLKLMETDLTREDFRTISSLASCISKMG